MERKKKVLGIAYLPGTPTRKTRYLVVEDAKEREWTFISGTCEPNEEPDACMLRELAEETRALVVLGTMPIHTQKYTITYHHWDYTVYFMPLQISPHEARHIQDSFASAPCDTCEYAENICLRFETYRQFIRRKNIWSFIREHVLSRSEWFLPKHI